MDQQDPIPLQILDADPVVDPVRVALVCLLLVLVTILVFIAPAIVIAVWRWAI